jgi:hypothetical protein
MMLNVETCPGAALASTDPTSHTRTNERLKEREPFILKCFLRNHMANYAGNEITKYFWYTEHIFGSR